MKAPFCLLFLLTGVLSQIQAQNVGIGTNSPLKLFSVNGSVLIDQDNKNQGTPDSAGLRFGTTTLVGIGSNRAVPANGNLDGLDFYTNGQKRVVITSLGRVGIGNASPAYPLDVTGTAKVGYLNTGGITSSGSIQTEFDLIANDDLQVFDDASIFGNMGVGGYYSTSYTLYVNGNGIFTTNLGVNGTLRVDGKITNGGKGIVKSNNSTTLRAGFTKGTFSAGFSAGQSYTVKFCITNFEGDNDNVRVMPAQFIPGSGNLNVGCIHFLPTTTLQSDAACSGGSSVSMRITNTCSTTANSGTDAVLYLFSVVTD